MTPLRRRMIEDMRIRNFSIHTQQAYVRYMIRFARHYRRSPAELGPKEIRDFQVHLWRNVCAAKEVQQESPSNLKHRAILAP